MQEAQDNSKKKLTQLIILKKTEISTPGIDYVRIHQHEFCLNGKLYDIIREIEKDSLIYIYCINDEEEEQLEKEFQKKADENTKGKAQEPANYGQLYSLISEAVCYLTLDNINESHSGIINYDQVTFSQYWEDIPTPPPKFLSSLSI